jgi:hypothetical protein
VTNLTPPADGWSADAPATAMQDGGGCLSASVTPPAAGTEQPMTVGGTYAGEVKQIDLTIFALSDPLYRKLGLGVSIDVSMSVDGKEVFSQAGLPGAEEDTGSVPGEYKGTFTVPDLDIPATDTAKTYELTIGAHFNDDWYVFGRGASDMASAITFSAQDDLPPPDPGEGA